MSDLISYLIYPFTFGFMQRGLAAGILVGIGCAVLGAFVVLRGMAFIGDALAHTILPGVVVAFLFGVNIFFGALVAGIFTAVGIGWFSREGHVEEDTAIGVMFSGLFALGILLLGWVKSSIDLTHLLFGNILGILPEDLWITGIMTAIVLLITGLFFKELLVTSFDPGHAAVIGLSPGAVRYGLLVLLALTVVSGIQTVGVVLVAALLVTPAATASLITKSLPRMMILAAGLSMIATLVGLYSSYYAKVASGATIVLTLTLFFVIAFLFAPKRGWVWQRAKRSQ